MPEYVRVKQKETGAEVSIFRHMYDFAPDAYDLLDKPATNAGGDPLPTKHKTTVAKSAAEKSAKAAARSGQQADTKKESDD